MGGNASQSSLSPFFAENEGFRKRESGLGGVEDKVEASAEKWGDPLLVEEATESFVVVGAIPGDRLSSGSAESEFVLGILIGSDMIIGELHQAGVVWKSRTHWVKHTKELLGMRRCGSFPGEDNVPARDTRIWTAASLGLFKV